MDPDDIDRRLAREVASLRETGQETGAPNFADRLVQALRDGLIQLDALPRDDVFWSSHANDRATPYKLSEYAPPHARLVGGLR